MTAIVTTTVTVTITITVTITVTITITITVIPTTTLTRVFYHRRVCDSGLRLWSPWTPRSPLDLTLTVQQTATATLVAVVNPCSVRPSSIRAV